MASELLTVSLVIPTKNAGEGFRETLRAIRRQSGVSVELVVVDSGSTDGTVGLAVEYGARTISIPPESFNHGETRNLGLRNTTAEYCVMMVQDALPRDDECLRNLIAPFSDDRVVGVAGRQIPRPDADLVGRWDVEWGDRFLGQQFQVREVPRWEDFLTWDYETRLRTAWFNNVCSAVRRRFWEKQPFRAVSFAEDLDWAVRALAAGYRIVYNPSACVLHSHSRPAAYRLKRFYVAEKITRSLLQAQPIGPLVRSDAEFFAAVNEICGAVQAMLADGLGTSPGIGSLDHIMGRRRYLWRCFRAAIGVGLDTKWEESEMRQHLDEILEQPTLASGSESAPARSRIVVQALAQTIGTFAGCYYRWCEANGCLSKDMHRLDALWSQGV